MPDATQPESLFGNRPASHILAKAVILQTWFCRILVLEVLSMAHKLSRKQPKEPFWRDVLRRWQQSGLTIRAFCRQRQLSEPAFYFWRRTLAERDRTSVAATPPVTFVPLTVRSETVAAEAVVEVVLTNGRRLRLPVGVGASVVRELLAVLEETPC